jgi:hypothetical protein
LFTFTKSCFLPALFKSAIYNLKSTIFLLPPVCLFLNPKSAIRNSQSPFSHPELRKEVPRLNNSGHPDQDEREANPEGFDLAIAEETEQRIGNKNDPSDRGEQNQCEKVVGVTLSHEVEIEQRTGNQDGAYESTYERISADSSARALNLWSLIHVNSLIS